MIGPQFRARKHTDTNPTIINRALEIKSSPGSKYHAMDEVCIKSYNRGTPSNISFKERI